MKKVQVSNLIPGMITAEDIYTFSGKLLVGRGVTLLDNLIAKLEFYSIVSVKVEDELAEGFFETNAPMDNMAGAKSIDTTIKKDAKMTLSEQIRQSPEFIEFKARFDEAVPRFKEILDATAMRDEDFRYNLLEDIPMSITNDGNMHIFDMLHNMREYDDMTYVHCINVALMCAVFARWLKLSDEDVKKAMMGGLLHDTGKVSIPDVIIRKPGKLTPQEYAMVKRHTIEGYNALKKRKAPVYICNTALMHHERSDGSGYPLGLHNEQIDYLAKMVSIIDVYDAMTSARCYRGPMCPFKVVAIFEEEGLTKYDIKLITTFLENIVNTYMAQTVLLSDGRRGEIVFINKNALSKPTIKINNDFVDLSRKENQNLFIEAIV